MSGKIGNVENLRREDKMIGEVKNDPYLTKGKPNGPAVCEKCGVAFSEGRWQWQAEPPKDAQQVLCPACMRIRDRVPAGYLTLSGDFYQQHRDEILNLVKNKVETQKARHPMKRLMDVEDQDDGSTVLTFTDVHLPRGAGDDIASAYEGTLDVKYADAGDNMRVFWER